jgi:hypothetical protein
MKRFIVGECRAQSTLLKIYVYGYLNRLPSSWWLERESRRSLELIWLTGRLVSSFGVMEPLGFRHIGARQSSA